MPHFHAFTAMNTPKIIAIVEALLLIAIGIAYWFPSPQRDAWLWVIALWIPLIAARWWVCRRLWTTTPFDELMIALMALFIINIFVAPFETRGILLIFRPLYGLILVWACVEAARAWGSIAPLLRGVMLFALFVGLAALLASDWSGKTAWVASVTAPLPNLRDFWLWSGGFNTNEIAGAMTWLAPLALALALKLRSKLAAGAALVLVIALLLGQSLSGIAGVIVGIAIAAAPRRWPVRLTALAVVGLIIGHLIIVISPRGAADILKAVSPREGVQSINHRAELWLSARWIINDYPLTGAGLAMYRAGEVRHNYPTPNFSPRMAVHPHNEVLQVATDAGLPGVLIYSAIHGMALVLLWRVWRDAPHQRAIAAGLAGGLIAHHIYGLADAIPLWDRFAFIGWWMLGLTAALYVVSLRMPPHPNTASSAPAQNDTSPVPHR